MLCAVCCVLCAHPSLPLSLSLPHRLAESTVGNRDAGGSRKSDTRTSRNSWVKRSTSPITESLFKRGADLLKLDEGLMNR